MLSWADCAGSTDIGQPKNRGIEMEYYSIIYANKKLETVVSFVKAEHYFAAEDKAKEDVQNWPHYHVYSIHLLDKKRIEAGEVVFCGG